MSVSLGGLQFRYSGESEGLVAQAAHRQVSRIRFDDRCLNSEAQDSVSTGLQVLLEEPGCEFILTDSLTVSGKGKNHRWVQTDKYLLLVYWVNETDFDGLGRATEHVYSQLHDALVEHGYPHLVRVWNYFADINGIEHGLERYRHFCVGRYNAYVARDMQEEHFPSACALGHAGGDLLVYALATKTAAQHFENPQQASAYRYPIEYGPRSPSFARASLVELSPTTAQLFVSGTASVVGHVTLHPDDIHLQIQVTLDNLACLLAHIGKEYAKQHDGNAPTMMIEVLKVYVRRAGDLSAIKEGIGLAYPSAPVVYLAADICRSDLLLEVDGIWNLACT